MTEMTPDLVMEGLSVWIHGREFPDSNDFWDGNWLRLRATMAADEAKVTIDGAYLRIEDFARFHKQLAEMHSSLSGEAALGGLEPNISLTLKMHRTGHVAGSVEITPDHVEQFHRFEFGLDQSYLPPILDSLEALLAAYPVRDSSRS
ncbi:hypothetical protein HFP51_00395 [Parasphingopyxis sp. CP4]|uniref:WapI family immunity protein n=1 Tax=Parasphingopyxis sp. CP4 TaxID=2724527 RepID=UPI0015A0F4A2|nr:hypothetical protein [Parasphingopyxis sp. CP4]QLC20776.1 hypothetical protein HFP51_00395 [Parasphingopyxis sp. CP4]